MINFEQIKKANDSIVTTDIKGKDYAEVNQRIKAFRMVYPNGSITTDIIDLTDGVVTMKAVIKNEEGIIIGSGFAQEKESSTFINKTSFIENCETSAVGRALGMCGFGIDTSVASAEEVLNAMENQANKNPKESDAPKKDTKANPPVEKVSKEQLKFINGCDEKLKSWLLKKFKLTKLEDLTFEQAKLFITKVEEKESKNGTN